MGDCKPQPTYILLKIMFLKPVVCISDSLAAMQGRVERRYNCVSFYKCICFFLNPAVINQTEQVMI